MAPDTPLDVRSLVIYQVFTRNYGPTGTFADVTADVARIAALGADVLYLLPIHPIGVEGRKGSAGSPYAIRDYRSVNPDLGSDEDFDALVAAAHGAGLKVMIDVVVNHTSPDSVLITEHPEFFHRDAEGKPYTTVPAWTDIIDLAHPNPDLTRYLIDSLAIWVRRGVDGFRCDVASLVPVDFWVQARTELAEIKPGLLWLAETVHPMMVESRRAAGIPTAGDGEMFAAFDIEYMYDIHSPWQTVVLGQEPASRYLEMLRWQDATLPGNYAKLRFVENHDQFRIMHFAPSRAQALAWTVLMACSRGPLMIYAGQESAATKWPSLFEPDPVAWGTRELAGFITACAGLKKHAAQRRGQFWILADEPCVQLAWALRDGDRLTPVPAGADGPATGGGTGLYAIVNIGAADGQVAVQLPDGEYRDLLSGVPVRVTGGRTAAPEGGVVVEFDQPVVASLWRTPLLDVFLHVEELGDEQRA
jgi:hypothetical protein